MHAATAKEGCAMGSRGIPQLAPLRSHGLLPCLISGVLQLVPDALVTWTDHERAVCILNSGRKLEKVQERVDHYSIQHCNTSPPIQSSREPREYVHASGLRKSWQCSQHLFTKGGGAPCWHCCSGWGGSGLPLRPAPWSAEAHFFRCRRAPR